MKTLVFRWHVVCAQQVPYGAHGYGSNFTLSVMDRDYVKGLTLDEALAIIDKCIHELHTRFLIAQTNFVIKVRYLRGAGFAQQCVYLHRGCLCTTQVFPKCRLNSFIHGRDTSRRAASSICCLSHLRYAVEGGCIGEAGAPF